jgi:hypothetical protein
LALAPGVEKVSHALVGRELSVTHQREDLVAVTGLLFHPEVERLRELDVLAASEVVGVLLRLSLRARNRLFE